MKLPKVAHTSRPWRIHEVTAGFRLEDVWALPTPGGPDDFPRLVRRFAKRGPEKGSRMTGLLMAIRMKIGELFGWDDSADGLGVRVASLRTRLPEDLLEAPPGPDLDGSPFSSVYLLENEWAIEIANRTVHAVLHLGWVEDGDGGYRGQMAILTKPNGLLGSAYMGAIMPFRYLLVYPAMLREIERKWHRDPVR